MKIKVKKVQDFDFGVSVHKVLEEKPTVDSVVADLRELGEEDFKKAVKIARQFRKADTMLDLAMPKWGGVYDY